MKDNILNAGTFLLGMAFMLSISATQILAGLIMLYLIYRGFKGDTEYKKFPFWKYIGIICITTIISTIFAVDFMHSLKHIDELWLYLFFPLGFLLVNRYGMAKTVLFGIFSGSIICNIIGISDYITHIGNDGYTRASSIFTHALTYGNTLVLISISTIIMLLKKTYNNRNEMIFIIVTLAGCLGGHYVSMSRGPMLALFASVLFILVVHFKKKGLVAAIILVMITTGFVASNHTMKKRFSEIVTRFDEPKSPIWTRVQLFKVGVHLIKEHPITGIGEANFRPLAKDYSENVMGLKLGSLAHTHNTFMQYMVTHGIIGFIAFMLFFFAQLKMGWIHKDNKYGLIFLGLFSAFMLSGMSESNYTDSEVAMLYFFMAGFFISKIFQEENT